MLLWPLLLIHICGATVGLLSGFLAMALRKGSGPHGAAGTVFFGSMLLMSSSAAYIAAFLRPNMANLVVAMLTFYLVVTARRTAKRRGGGTDRFDVAALLFVLMVGVTGVASGFQAASSPTGTKDHMPAAVYFIFGSVALLCAFSDLRMVRRGGVVGTQRIVRHLWRMCVALLITTFSFYPGQAKLFSREIRETNLLYIPVILLIGAMLFSRVRIGGRKRVQRDEAMVAQQSYA